MITPPRLAADWPLAEQRIRRFLASQGRSGVIADDIVQEIAARALSSGLRYGSVDELVRWGCTVARNLSITEHRRTARLTDPSQAEGVTGVAPDAEALGRVELEATLTAISRLSARDQEVLLSQLRPPTATGDRRADVRSNVALFRARGRLLRMLAAVVAPLGVPWPRWRRAGGLVLAAAVTVALPLTFATLDKARPGPGPEMRPTDSFSVAGTPPKAAASVGTASTVTPLPARPAGRRASVSSPDGLRAEKSLLPAPAPKHVEITTPAGPNVAGVRPKRPGDALVCVDAFAGLPRTCVG